MTIGMSVILPAMLYATFCVIEKQMEAERKAVEERLNSYDNAHEN